MRVRVADIVAEGTRARASGDADRGLRVDVAAQQTLVAAVQEALAPLDGKAAGAIEGLQGQVALRVDPESPSDKPVLWADVELAVSQHRACDRCGAGIDLSLKVDTTLLYAPPAAGEEGSASFSDDDEDAIDLSEADLDHGWYDGKGLDLQDVVSEAVALTMPSTWRCADAGLAPCAVPEAATADKPPSPFAALRDLF